MVVLNACRSARTDAIDPFGGMAQGLVQQDATAVVAMQFPISDRAAVTFTGEFYGALVDGLPVDQAVSSARKSLLAEFQRRVGHARAVPALARRQHLRERARRARRRTRPKPDEVRPDRPGRRSGSPPRAGRQRPPQAGARRCRGSGRRLVVALLVVVQLGDDDVDPSPASCSPTPQLLVAAGDSADELHIFRFDATTGEEGAKPLTTGTTHEFNPVLSPDRTTMIYSRKRASGNQLRAAWRINGSGDRPLFDESSLTECSESTGRPAWIPGTDDLVMRCFGSDGFIRMVGVDIHGNFKDTYDEIEPDDKSQDFGHPTVSPDGTIAVYPVGVGRKSREGTLFAIDLETHRRRSAARSGGQVHGVRRPGVLARGRHARVAGHHGPARGCRPGHRRGLRGARRSASSTTSSTWTT